MDRLLREVDRLLCEVDRLLREVDRLFGEVGWFLRKVRVHRVIVRLGEVAVPLISIRDLIRMKQGTGRAQDEGPWAGRAGFDYYLSEEQFAAYRDKPLELRLAWLYQGNVLRMHYPPEIIARQDRFRRMAY